MKRNIENALKDAHDVPHLPTTTTTTTTDATTQSRNRVAKLSAGDHIDGDSLDTAVDGFSQNPTPTKT